MSEFSIQLTNISKYYKLYPTHRSRLYEALNPFGKEMHQKYYALKNIDLEVNKGEVLGIVGKNGSGKSTLLKIISGVLTPNSGIIKVNGKVTALLELGSGFNPEFTGLQNIYFYASIVGINKKKIDHLLDDILAFADIGDYIYQPLKTYSSGMKVRLAFSVSTIINPEILILDEVLAVGDAQFRAKSGNRIKSLMDSGATVLLVSHSEDSINRLCSRAIYLRDGECVISGKPKDVTKLYIKASSSSKNISNEQIKVDFKKIEEERESLPKKANNNLIDESLYSTEIFSKSYPVFIENYPIEFLGISIINVEGNKVNILNSGVNYRISVKYKFKKSNANVTFPVSIFHENGQHLFGIRHPSNGSSHEIDEGRIVEITIDFNCSLLKGMYALGCGVAELKDGRSELLFRVQDALSFKVVDNGETEHWGIFTPQINEHTLKIVS